MEGIYNLKDLLQPGDWLAKVDLKDAFFTIPIYTTIAGNTSDSFSKRGSTSSCASSSG